jgi:DNA polymerase epsilon subunit 4
MVDPEDTSNGHQESVVSAPERTSEPELKGESAIAVPLARVKRIMKQDDDIVTVSSGAVVAMAAATEMFVQYFTEQALMASRANPNKRKNLQYNDFASAVAMCSELEFLSCMCSP